jgi:hypothetical protein
MARRLTKRADNCLRASVVAKVRNCARGRPRRSRLVAITSLLALVNLTAPVSCHASSSSLPDQANNNETIGQPASAAAASGAAGNIYNGQMLDFKALASEFQQDKLKTDTLIKVINDTHGIKEPTRRRLYELISEYKSATSSNETSTSTSTATGAAAAAAAEPAGRPSGNKGLAGGQRRRIIYEDTIFTKRALREIESKMNMSYEGESRSDPSIHWVILYNDTTILVVRSANKYYYWKVSCARPTGWWRPAILEPN